ncbi:cleavage furrow ingression [Homalodisca vitripennis]|nr:cleavage furrow ingression [Homalodisca vitripennis]
MTSLATAVQGTSLDHPNHTGESIPFPGVYIKLEFISREEESSLIQDLDSIPWDLSQSGRRKQASSILSAISKVLEDLFLGHIKLTLAGLICSLQHGFTDVRSTISNSLLGFIGKLSLTSLS